MLLLFFRCISHESRHIVPGEHGVGARPDRVGVRVVEYQHRRRVADVRVAGAAGRSPGGGGGVANDAQTEDAAGPVVPAGAGVRVVLLLRCVDLLLCRPGGLFDRREVVLCMCCFFCLALLLCMYVCP